MFTLHLLTMLNVCTALFILLPLTWRSVGSIQLFAPNVVTRDVTISCQYNSNYRQNTKYWCRGPVYDYCQIVVKTSKPRVREGRIDQEAGVFTITMSALR